MKKIIALIMIISMPAFADSEIYEQNIAIGSCKVTDSDLRADFYVRNTDLHFEFELKDSKGDVFYNTDVKHRQNIFTEDYGFKLRNNKVRLKQRNSYYKADFVYNMSKGTAYFKHKAKCIKTRSGHPCVVHLDKYKINFNECDLDFSEYL